MYDALPKGVSLLPDSKHLTGFAKVLRQEAIRATAWSGADILLRQGLQFATTMVLARLLTPADFGTIALLYLFIGIATAFADGGLPAAIIQRRDITETDMSTAFWLTLGAGTGMAILLAALAPLIADFYRTAVLTPLTRALAVNVFLSAAGAIPNAAFLRRLDFKTPMKIGGFSSLASGILGIWFAWSGFGVWALVVQTLSATVITTLLLWASAGWRPRWELRAASARQLFGYGGYLFAAGLLDVIYNRAYSLLLGKWYGVRELAYYSRADGAKQLPVSVLTGVVSRVALPVLSKAAGDKDRLRRGVQQALRFLMFINAPVMTGMIATADALIHVLFGRQWAEAVPTFRILCLAGILWPLHVINLNALMAQGKSSLFFRLEIIKKIAGASLLLVGASFGVAGVAWSQVGFGVVAFLINTYYTEKFLGYGAMQQIRDFAPVLGISLGVSGVVYVMGTTMTAGALAQLIAQVAIGVTIFLVTCQVMGLKAFRDAVTLLGGQRR